MIRVTEIHKRYGTLEVLRGVSLEVRRGEVVTIVGASGAGKTTLLQIMGTLSRPDAGRVEIDGTDVFALGDKSLSRFRNERIGFVFQFHHLLPEFTAFENVCIPGLIGRRPRAEVEQRADELLAMMGLAARRDHKPSQLSGGERQRVFLAMLLAQNTDVVLLDEPTTYLDAHHKFELMALLSTLKAQNKAVGIVLRELPLAFKFCDRLLLMKNGQIMQSGTPEELLKTGLIEHLFGVSLTPVMLDKEVEYIERKIHS